MSAGRDAINVAGNYAPTIHEALPPSIRSLYQLPPPVSDFVGRELEIEQLGQALTKGTESGEAAICGIRGLGGVGKTQLALAVAQHVKDSFPDAQLLIELRGASDNSLTPEQALQTIIRAFEPLAQLQADLTGLRASYLTLLNGKRVLVMADDAHDRKQVETLLPPPGCAMLLTSRQRFNLPGMETLDLEILPAPEAEKLLWEIYPAIGPAAPRMAQLCGRLPLALRLYASMCANSTMSIEYHLKALESEKARLALLRDPDDPKTSVEASIGLSYDALDLPVQQVLCQLSIFPSSFHMSAASAVVEVPGVPGAEDQEATTKPRTVEEMLDLLYRRSLLDWDRQIARYSLHDLVRVFALTRLEGEDAVRMRYAQHYARVAALVGNLYVKDREGVLLGLRLFDEERANIDAGWNWAREQTGSTSPEVDELLLDYANGTAYVGDLRYDKRRERIPQIEAAVGAARRLNRKEQEGNSLGNLGLAYINLGEIRKAIQYYDQRIKLAHEIGDRQGEGIALGNLGLAYANLGETRKAIQYYDQYLEIAHEIGDRRGEGIVLGNLGTAYKVLGETRKAIQYYEQNLEIAREIGDRQGEGDAMGSLGNAYRTLGETDKAIQYYEQTLEIAREIGDRHNEGSTLGNLGLTYATLGETRKAIQYYEQNLEIARKIGYRQVEAIASWNLGMLLAEEGNLARVVELTQVRVDYEREIGHVDAERHAAIVAELRKKLT
jgi:tetratricopeptide (TPR) repeat protein